MTISAKDFVPCFGKVVEDVEAMLKQRPYHCVLHFFERQRDVGVVAKVQIMEG